MHLIAPLAVGMRGARNGTVFAYLRGTATPAPVWADASGKLRRHGALRLDKLGQISLYVDQLVDILVYDSTMLLVRRWTDGRSAGAVVVEHPAFTGVDYETGVSGVGERTTLVEALGRWLPSAGAVDWNVLVDGVPTSVMGAVENVVGVFYDPRSFGSIGDGTGDDVAPIQAAIDTARAAGGGVVYLRAGTYRITSFLNLYENVSLLGDGASSTRIVIASIIDPAVAISGSSDPAANRTAPGHYIRGIAFAAELSTPSSLVNMTAGNISIDRCLFDGTFNTGPLFSIQKAEGLRIDSSRFKIVAVTTTAISTEGSPADLKRAYVDGCTFEVPDQHAAVDGVIGKHRLHVDGCLFDMDATTTGTSYKCVRLSGVVHGAVDGCEVTAHPATMTSGLLSVSTLDNAAERVFEDCSLIDNTIQSALYLVTEANAAPLYHCRVKSADARHAPIVQNTEPLDAGVAHFIAGYADRYGITSNFNTGAGASAPPDSGVVMRDAISTDTVTRIPLGRTVDSLYFTSSPENFLLFGGLTNASALGFYMAKVTSLRACRVICTRVFSQYPGTPAEQTKLCLLTTGDIQAVFDGRYPGTYGPI